MDVFNKYVRLAEMLHRRYQAERSSATPTAPRERLLMLPFDQTVAETYAVYMRTPQWDVLERAQVYRNTPLALAQTSYRRWIDAASQHAAARSEEHTSELQSLMRNSYAVFCLNKKNNTTTNKSDRM